MTELELATFLAPKVPRYKLPKRFFFWDALPKSDYGRPKEPQMPEISGKARHSCARHRFGGQGTARPPYLRRVAL